MKPQRFTNRREAVKAVYGQEAYNYNKFVNYQKNDNDEEELIACFYIDGYENLEKALEKYSIDEIEKIYDSGI